MTKTPPNNSKPKTQKTHKNGSFSDKTHILVKRAREGKKEWKLAG